MRASGILMHISSLPSDYGIGSFGKEAYTFIDFLRQSGQQFWQVLPLGSVEGNSPYQPVCCFGGNYYFIDPDILAAKGLLTGRELSEAKFESDRVNYSHIRQSKKKLLWKAFERFALNFPDDFENFCAHSIYWLEDFAAFSALRDKFGPEWRLWPRPLAFHETEAVKNFCLENKETVNFYKFLQYEFFSQWHKLKNYANTKGIKIIGDMPIYPSDGGSDIWARPQLFDIEPDLSLKNVAGVPPDAFSRDGQMWGNPVYNWPAHRRDGYSWWKNRLNAAMDMYDVVRLDHFRGFESYWSIPGTARAARQGDWKQGPGEEFFMRTCTDKNNFKIIAEDLGVITPQVRKLLKATGFPGMKILQFAFNPWENSDYLPHNIEENSVVYTGTHDNLTINRWWARQSPEHKKFFLDYGAWEDDKNIPDKMIALAFISRAKLAVVPMQDWLGLGEEGIMNIPSTIEGNWEWRMKKEALTDRLAQRIKDKTALYGRRPWQNHI